MYRRISIAQCHSRRTREYCVAMSHTCSRAMAAEEIRSFSGKSLMVARFTGEGPVMTHLLTTSTHAHTLA
jgi:hypothetical protein